MSSRSHSLTRALLIASAGAALLASVGCATGGDKHVGRFRSNPTPLLHTPGQTGVESANRMALTSDTNGRLVNKDLGRLLLSDRPSRLAKEPIPY